MKIPPLVRVKQAVLDVLVPDKKAIKKVRVQAWLMKILPKAWAEKFLSHRSVKVAGSAKRHTLSRQGVSSLSELALSSQQMTALKATAKTLVNHIAADQGGRIIQTINDLMAQICEYTSPAPFSEEQLQRLVQQLVSEALKESSGQCRNQVLSVLKAKSSDLLAVMVAAKTHAKQEPDHLHLQLFQAVGDAACQGLCSRWVGTKQVVPFARYVRENSIAGSRPGVLPASTIRQVGQMITQDAVDFGESKLSQVWVKPGEHRDAKRVESLVKTFDYSDAANAEEQLEYSARAFIQAVCAQNRDAMVLGSCCLMRDVMALASENKPGAIVGASDAPEILAPVVARVVETLSPDERQQFAACVQSQELARTMASINLAFDWYTGQFGEMSPLIQHAAIASAPMVSEVVQQIVPEQSEAFNASTRDISTRTFEGGRSEQDLTIHDVHRPLNLFRVAQTCF